MQVKVFRAKNMKEALKQVKETFGPDALILSTRTVRKERFGFLRTPELEVTAAQESAANQNGPRDNVGFEQELQTQVSGLSQSLGLTYDVAGRLQTAFADKESPDASLGQNKDETGGVSSLESQEFSSLRSELREIRHLLMSQAQTVEQVHAPQKTGGVRPERPELRLMQDKGISREVAEAIVASQGRQLPASEEDQTVASWCRECLADWVQVGDGVCTPQPQSKRIVLVGPTGVGKTTTLAKLAAHYLRQVGWNLLLVTIDNYRIAATEQLRIYAEIMNVPLEVVSTPEQLNTVLRRQGVNRLTLIDTAGRNPRDSHGLQELQAFLGQGQGFDKYLVMSATTREDDLHGIVDRFSPLGIDGLIFTKLDETDRFGPLVNIQYSTGCPFVYLTNGQRVPEDLQLADPNYVSSLIVNPDGEVPHDS